MDPKAHNMAMFPAADPKEPDAGPSWDYAERCIPLMRAAKPTGYRTKYLSKKWLSCRAGAYDNWEWRSGKTGGAVLTPSFVNYLCWEMNEWIGRGIFDAIYLDECYEENSSSVESGMAIRLPDGSVQQGVDNFQFRELMKRWRNIFHAHGKKPMLLGHHTYSWQYQGLVFCDGYLDGENAPIVSLSSRDWIDSTSKARYEVLQNSRLWGNSSFYMPFIAEGGFFEKERSQFPVWQWRIARQAQSQFAHYETATVYEWQGDDVHHRYWDDLESWGALEPTVGFHPYWDNDAFISTRFRGRLAVEDQGKTPDVPADAWTAGHTGDVMVSFYRKADRVLIIASNRRKRDAVARIDLDAKALGLPSELVARAIDGTFNPPDGDDYVGQQAIATEAAKSLEVNPDDFLADEDALDALTDDELLHDPDAQAADRVASWRPRIEGNTLVVPIRARDYRVVSVEPASE